MRHTGEKTVFLSACVIVKDEAAHLPRWLADMKQVADEMIVVDTGSRDDSKSIAAAAGARVYDFAWIDDFAAAKNYALQQAHGSWIIFLDADEYFTSESLPRLRPLLRQLDGARPGGKLAGGLLCRLVNIDMDAGGRQSSVILQQRVFRHAPGIRYVGAVHEALTMNGQYTLELTDELTIYHTGYSSRIVKQKLKRNLRLLRQHIAAQGGRIEPEDERYLMDIWYGLGHYEQAVASARRLLAEPELADDLRTRCYEIWASSCIEGNLGAQAVCASLAAARQACPHDAEFVLMEGLWQYEQGDYLKAEQLLRRGNALHENWQREQAFARRSGQAAAVSISALLDNAVRLLPTVEWRQGQLAARRRDFEQAQEHYLKGLKLNPYHVGLVQSFFGSLLRAGASATDCIEILNGLYPGGASDARFLTGALGMRAGQVYLYYRQRAVQQPTGDAPLQTDIYLAAGRYDAAVMAARYELDMVYRLVDWADGQGEDVQGILALRPGD